MRTRAALRAPALLIVLLVGGAASAIAQGPPTDTGSVETNGVRLFYRSTGSGSPMLLLHGLGATGAWWDSVVPALAVDHTVIVPDLRGHGRSTNPSGRYTHALVAEDLIGLLDSLRIPRVQAIGHSSGAAALLYLASRAPSRVDRMTVIGMGARVTAMQRSRWQRTPAIAQQDPLVRAYMLRVQPGGAAQADAILGYLRALGADTTDINFDAATLSRISAHTLIIGGDRDGHTVENLTALYRGIPNSSLWIVPGQSHYPFWTDWGGDSVMARVFPVVARRFLSAGQTSPPATAPGSDEDAVRAVLARTIRDLERHDWADYSMLWAHEPTVSVVHPARKEWVDGWEALAGKYRALIADTALRITATTYRQDVNVSASHDMAWVAQQDTLHFTRGNSTSDVVQWSTSVLVKRDGVWKLVHAQASQMAVSR